MSGRSVSFSRNVLRHLTGMREIVSLAAPPLGNVLRETFTPIHASVPVGGLGEPLGRSAWAFDRAILQPVLTEAEVASGAPRPVGCTALQVGILSQWYEPEPQPVPQVLARELRTRGHSVRVLTGFPNYPTGHVYDGYRVRWRSDQVVSGVPVRRVALYPSHDASRIGRLANYGSFAASAFLWGTGFLKDIDSLWVYNSPPTVGLPTWLIKARYRPRVILHIMDLWPESLIASGFGRSMVRSPFVESALDRWLHATYRTADVIACSSRRQMDILARRGVADDKLSYAPPWVDEGIFQPSAKDADLESRFGLAGKKLVLLYAGQLGEAQGLDVLIEACDRVRDLDCFHCLIAGSGVA